MVIEVIVEVVMVVVVGAEVAMGVAVEVEKVEVDMEVVVPVGMEVTAVDQAALAIEEADEMILLHETRSAVKAEDQVDLAGLATEVTFGVKTKEPRDIEG